MLTALKRSAALLPLVAALALGVPDMAQASVLQPIATIPFADGTSASVAMHTDVSGPSQNLQDFVFTIPAGHSITVNILNGNGDIIVETVTQQGPCNALVVSVPNRPIGRNATFQMQVNSQ